MQPPPLRCHWYILSLSSTSISNTTKIMVSKSEASQKLLVSDKPHRSLPVSARIPAIARPFVSDRALRTLDLVERFVEEESLPADPVLAAMLGNDTATRFSAHPPILEDLKRRARELGLWNMFLPVAHFKEGAGFSNLEYGLMAEQLGRSLVASEACNCSAPDTGNMEVIAKYGTEEQKRTFLEPLLAGEWRSAFLMTEPDVSSSDATNIEMRMERSQDGKEWVLNGSVSCAIPAVLLLYSHLWEYL